MNIMAGMMLIFWIATIVCGVVGFSLDITEFKALSYIFLVLTGVTLTACYFNLKGDSDDETN